MTGGTFLAVQWLRIWASTAKGPGSIPNRGTRIPHAAWTGQTHFLKSHKWAWVCVPLEMRLAVPVFKDKIEVSEVQKVDWYSQDHTKPMFLPLPSVTFLSFVGSRKVTAGAVRVKVAPSCQNAGVSSLSLLQGIFPTQGSNSGLPYCRRILYRLSHQGSPVVSSNQPTLQSR